MLKMLGSVVAVWGRGLEEKDVLMRGRGRRKGSPSRDDVAEERSNWVRYRKIVPNYHPWRSVRELCVEKFSSMDKLQKR